MRSTRFVGSCLLLALFSLTAVSSALSSPTRLYDDPYVSYFGSSDDGTMYLATGADVGYPSLVSRAPSGAVSTIDVTDPAISNWPIGHAHEAGHDVVASAWTDAADSNQRGTNIYERLTGGAWSESSFANETLLRPVGPNEADYDVTQFVDGMPVWVSRYATPQQVSANTGDSIIRLHHDTGTKDLCDSFSDLNAVSRGCALEDFAVFGDDIAVLLRMSETSGTQATYLNKQFMKLWVRHNGAWALYDLQGKGAPPLFTGYGDGHPPQELVNPLTQFVVAMDASRVSILMEGYSTHDPAPPGGFDNSYPTHAGVFSIDKNSGSSAFTNFPEVAGMESFTSASWYPTLDGFRGGLGSYGNTGAGGYYRVSSPNNGSPLFGQAPLIEGDHSSFHELHDGTIFMREGIMDPGYFRSRVTGRTPAGEVSDLGVLDFSGSNGRLFITPAGYATAVGRQFDGQDLGVYRFDFLLQPAQLRIDAAPSGATKQRAATVAFSSDNATSFECTALNSDAFAPCTSPLALADLADGSYRLTVRAMNGQAEGDETTIAWTVDTTAPKITITDTPDTITDGVLTTSFTTNETATTQCHIDQQAPVLCTSPYAFSNIAEGGHVLEVLATDAAGNVGQAQWSFDRLGRNSCALSAKSTRSLNRASRSVKFDCRAWPEAVDSCTDDKAEAGFQLADDVIIQALDPDRCFTMGAGSQWFSKGPVRVSGLLFVPDKGTTIVVHRAQRRFTIVGSSKLVFNYNAGAPSSWVPMPSKVLMVFRSRNNTVDLPLLEKAVAGANFVRNKPTLPGGLPPTNNFSIGFSSDDGGSAAIKTTVALPQRFQPAVDDGATKPQGMVGSGATVGASLDVSNSFQGGITFAASIAELRFGMLLLRQTTITYSTSKNALVISSKARMLAGSRAGVDVIFSGEFTPAPLKGSVMLESLNKPLPPPYSWIWVQGLGLNFDFSSPNWVLGGSSRFTLGPQVSTFNPADRFETKTLMSMSGNINEGYNAKGEAFARFEGSGFLYGNQDANLMTLPTASLEFNFAQVQANLAFRGKYNVGPLALDFDADAHAGGAAPAFISGRANVAMLGVGHTEAQMLMAVSGGHIICVSQDSNTLKDRLQSDRKVSLTKGTWGVLTTRQGVNRLLDGCDIGTYQRNGLPARSRAVRSARETIWSAAALPDSFTVAAGDALVAFKFPGASYVEFTRPDGKVLRAQDNVLDTNAMSVINAEGAKHVVIESPMPGTWKVATDAQEMLAARSLPDPGATVALSGALQKAARWSIARRPAGVAVQLQETDATGRVRVLGALKGARGILRFSAQPGKHVLTVVVRDSDGQVRQMYDVARYAGPPVAKLKQLRLKAVRMKGGVKVSWARQPGALWRAVVNVNGVTSLKQLGPKTTFTIKAPARGVVHVTVVGTRGAMSVRRSIRVASVSAGR